MDGRHFLRLPALVALPYLQRRRWASCPIESAYREGRAGSYSVIHNQSRHVMQMHRRQGFCKLDGRINAKAGGKVEVLPFPGSLSTQTRPFIISSRRTQMVRPRPLPPYLRAMDPSA